MGNSNPKGFFDFDHGKVPHMRLKPQKGGFLPRMGYLFVNHFLTIFLRLGQEITADSCSAPRKTLGGSKILSKIDLYSQISIV